MTERRIDRRQFLALGGIPLGAALLAACGGKGKGQEGGNSVTNETPVPTATNVPNPEVKVLAPAEVTALVVTDVKSIVPASAIGAFNEFVARPFTGQAATKEDAEVSSRALNAGVPLDVLNAIGFVKQAQWVMESPPNPRQSVGARIDVYGNAGMLLVKLACDNPQNASLAEAFLAVKAIALKNARDLETNRQIERGSTEKAASLFFTVPSGCQNQLLLAKQ